MDSAMRHNLTGVILMALAMLITLSGCKTTGPDINKGGIPASLNKEWQRDHVAGRDPRYGPGPN